MNCPKCVGNKIKIKCTSRYSPSSNISAFSLNAKLDISIMYSLILLLPLYFMEMSLAKRLLVFAFSFLSNYCSMSSIIIFAFSPSEIKPWNAYGIERFTTIMHIRLERSYLSIFTSLEASEVEVDCSVLNVKSKSIQPKIISTVSFQTLKFFPFSIGILFT